MDGVRFHEMPDGGRIAFRHLEGAEPALVFLPGYMSDMAGGKASAVFEWARGAGRACLLFDYSGCGQSTGAFAEGTLTRWREEAIALIEARCTGSVVVIGSSMGGWLSLLVALAIPARVAALVGIAAAPDFTEWGYSPAQRQLLEDGHTVLKKNPYGAEPTPTHPAFWRDGQAQRLFGAEIALDCPVRLLHGQADRDVPWDTSLRLAAALRSEDVQAVLIKDGDHRLSRESDIALLCSTIAALPT